MNKTIVLAYTHHPYFFLFKMFVFQKMSVFLQSALSDGSWRTEQALHHDYLIRTVSVAAGRVRSCPHYMVVSHTAQTFKY